MPAPFDEDLEALFAAPLSEFITARKALASKLKVSGRRDEAAVVQALQKPTVSAWVVNQLYSRHRRAFERLIETGGRLREEQLSQLAGRSADVRAPLEERRSILTELLRTAADLLREEGHSPSPDMLRRIATTLEALSVLGSQPDAPHAGRLAADLDPPGFNILAQAVPQTRANQAEKPDKPASPEIRARLRKEKAAAATTELHEAERVLAETQAHAQELLAAQQDAAQRARHAEAQRREAQQRLDEAIADEKRTQLQEAPPPPKRRELPNRWTRPCDEWKPHANA